MMNSHGWCGTFAVMVLALVAAGCGTTGPNGNPPPSPPPGPVIATASLDPARTSVVVPSAFAGLSFEMSGLTRSFNGVTGGVNPVFVQLLANLAAFEGPPVLRIGGNSEDQSWWNPTGLSRPAGVTFDITTPWMQTLTGLLAQTGSPVIVGANLALNDTAQAIAFSRAVVAAVPRAQLLGIEVGNETDLFNRPPNDSTPAKRPPTWGFTQYDSEFVSYATAIRRAIQPAPPIVGPAWATFSWIGSLPTLIQAPGVSLVSLHAYPVGNGALPSTDPKAPTIPRLLSDSMTHVVAQRFAPQIAVVAAAGLPFRMGETNSAYDGGKDSVSNAFASALWGIDYMFELANVGASGVNFHSGGSAYSPFRFAANGQLPLDVRPLYLGMLVFAEATTNRAHLVPVTTQSTANVKVWATSDAAGVLRVVVLNKDLAASGTVTLTLPASRGVGEVARLQAPSIAALRGVTYAGQSFDGSVTGLPSGTRQVETLAGTAGSYSLSMPAGSAALVTWR